MPLFLHRYDRLNTMRSDLDHVDDLCDWLSGLESLQQVVDILCGTRGITQSEAKVRARRAVHYAAISGHFIAMTRSARAEVAFLPGYYAVLNLCKLMLACSDKSSELARSLRHGVSYESTEKRSRGLFTEKVRLWKSGVFSLLYEELTGQPLPLEKGTRSRSLNLSEVYSRIVSVESEYEQAASRRSANLYLIQWGRVVSGRNSSRLTAILVPLEGRPLSRRVTLPVPRGWQRYGRKPLNRKSPPQQVTEGEFDPYEAIDRRFLYFPPGGDPAVKHSISSTAKGELLFPEEAPIFLALFHLSSIVRYKPEFLDTLRQSSAWPLVLAARRHLLFQALRLALSYVRQEVITLIRHD